MLLLQLTLLVFYFLPFSEESVGGELATRHEFPSLLLLKYDTGSGTYNPICGGLLISNYSYVLTSSLCYIPDLARTFVLAGVHDSSLDEITMQRRILRHIVSLPNGSIVALYRLLEPFEETAFVRSAEIVDNSKQFESGILPGWGSSNINNRPNLNFNGKLRKVRLPVVSEDECVSQTSLDPPESRFCTGKFLGGLGGCGADTGAPMFCNGLICGVLYQGSCGKPRKHDLFTNLNYYARAIDDAIALDKTLSLN